MDDEQQYLYRVAKWNPKLEQWCAVGNWRGQKTRAYDKLSTARSVKSQWSKHERGEFRIERAPVTWETVE